MTYKLTTYKTLTGNREILEIINKKNTEWIVYQKDKPTYYIDCFDIETEANMLMNNMVICEQQSIKDVLAKISKEQQVKLSLKKPPFVGIKIKTEIKTKTLPPLPEQWLQKM